MERRRVMLGSMAAMVGAGTAGRGRGRWYATFYAPCDDGWGRTALPMSGPSTEFPPDRPPTLDYEPYPASFVPPFHYANPVTER